jgi:hypothetical protein
MADPVTISDLASLTADHSDIRREQAEQTSTIRRETAIEGSNSRQQVANGVSDLRFAIGQGDGEIIKEGLKSQYEGVSATKDARYDLADRIESTKDGVKDQASAYFIAEMQSDRDAARDIASLKTLQDSMASALSNQIALNAEKVATANALEAAKNATALMLENAKNASAVALGQALLSRDIFADGDKTRSLINDQKYHDLNRALVERNAELVEERHAHHHWRHSAEVNQSQAQWASVQSQLQAFASQIQDVKQGTVNFGTMSGNAGRNTATNNVA